MLDALAHAEEEKQDGGRGRDDAEPVADDDQRRDFPVAPARQHDADCHQDSYQQGVDGIAQRVEHGVEHAA